MTIDELFSKLGTLCNPISLHPNWLHRGQPDTTWSLEPSLARIVNKRKLTKVQAIQVEREAVNKFSIAARSVLPLELTATLLPSKNSLDFVGWFSLMQHFSAPTRSLDWSISPWVALYFACIDCDDEDGAIWVMNYEKAMNKADQALNGKDFMGLINDPNAMDIVHLTMALNSNERIEAQQGRFTVSSNPLMDHADFFTGTDILEKIVIPKNLKSLAMTRLNSMNINAKTLFPGVDGLGRSISEFYKNWDVNSQIK